MQNGFSGTTHNSHDNKILFIATTDKKIANVITNKSKK